MSAPPAPPTDTGKKRRPFQVGVRTLVVLVFCCGPLLWAARGVWEMFHPTHVTVRAMGSKNPEDRLLAVHELGNMGPGEAETAFTTLITALRDMDARVRAAAASALASTNYYVASEPVLKARAHAAATALFEALSDDDSSVRIAAMNSLSSLSMPRTVSAAHSGAGSVSGPPAGTGAGQPTAPIDPGLVIPPLLRALGDKDSRVKEAGILALGSISRGVPMAPPMAVMACLDDAAPRVRQTAIQTISRFSEGHDAAVPALLQVLEKDRQDVRATCIHALGTLHPSPAVIPTLLKALEKPNLSVRESAAAMLGRFGPDAAACVPGLIAMLNAAPPNDVNRAPGGSYQDSSGGVYMFPDPTIAAFMALGKVAPGTNYEAEAIEALEAFVRSKSPERRSFASSSLAEFGPSAARTLPTLIQSLKESNAAPRAPLTYGATVHALGRIAPNSANADEAIQVLVDTLDSPDFYACHAAVNALRQFGPRARSAAPKLRELYSRKAPTGILGFQESIQEALTALGDSP